MREIFVSDLIKNVLGPRNGMDEDMNQNPLSEYITGVLSPIGSYGPADSLADDRAEIPTDSSMGGEADDNSDHAVNISDVLSPALDPKKTPSSMGLSFLVQSESVPKIRVCLTWARYYETNEKTKVWRRNPRKGIIDISLDKKDLMIPVDSAGKISNDGKEISIHVYVREKEHMKHVTVLFVNRIQYKDNARVIHHIFQPQIRIICDNKTKLVPLGKDSKSQDDMELQYKNKPIFAKGHLTSAIWKDVDPEIIPEQTPIIDFKDTLKNPGFFWIDGQNIDEEDRETFSKPDLRTEYVPMYSVPASSFEWSGDQNNMPEFDASKLAECFDPAILRNKLTPLVKEYKIWIDKLKKQQNMDPKYEKTLKKIISDCETTYVRINEGIEKICGDNDARMAFCFANKAIDTQSVWKNNTSFTYRPFQLAFILGSIESLFNPSSKFRHTCDLLWVPTGGGKTEAYLVIVAAILAYRRIKSLKNNISDNTGAGVSVISRYTLRLLTIQQFRRSLSIITACEFLRISNFGTKKGIGWRPESNSSTDDLIWGSTPFSAGLWVGSSVTPNKLMSVYNSPVSGAIDILRKDIQGENGEPAQVLNCPACDAILAIPAIGLHRGNHTIHFVFSCDVTDFENHLNGLKNINIQNLTIKDFNVSKNLSPGHFTLSLQFITIQFFKSREVDLLWKKIEDIFIKNKIRVKLKSSKASRSGYFLRSYIKQNRKIEDCDFDIFCANPKCPLKIKWFGGMPFGKVNGRYPDPNMNSNKLDEIKLPDQNFLVDIHKSFEIQRFLADRIPIPAYTVDEQVYQNIPSMVIGTVDKFARLPFEPNTASLFGNVEYYHSIWGYGRVDDSGIKHPLGPASARYYLNDIRRRKHVDLIIQDELHLIEGPLGSLVGMYETAIDFLASRKNIGPKYIASTATIKKADEHIRAVFARDTAVFPPPGFSADDRFFVQESERHQISDQESGRLYVGICAPGKGALSPLVRIWARLAQTGGDHKDDQKTDPFWTIIGYFNAVRDLGGAVAMYRQDIPEWVRHLSPDSPRPLPDDKILELSSRTSSTDLPSILNILNRSVPDAPDGLFTTSMFGTGVDISRIGLMIVNGQPKTTSAYIQSTGRVGRKNGALVVTFFRASRPRDLSHYEFFLRHHRQMHRFVEPPTLFPFAPGVQERALGPVMVSMLRNMGNLDANWSLESSASLMSSRSDSPEVKNLLDVLENRSQQQPDGRRPLSEEVKAIASSEIDRWRSFSEKYPDSLKYVEYFNTQHEVVLGDPRHFHEGKSVVYRNAPTSLREVEEEVGFET